MFQIMNASPISIQCDLDPKRVSFQPGETRGIWNDGTYFTFEEVKALTNDVTYGKIGLVRYDDDMKKNWTQAKIDGERKFLAYVRGMIDNFLELNSERKNNGRMGVQLYQRPKLEELIKYAEKICEKKEHAEAGTDISRSFVMEQYQLIWGGVIIKEGESPKENMVVKKLQEELDDQKIEKEILAEELKSLKDMVQQLIPVKKEPELEEVENG